MLALVLADDNIAGAGDADELRHELRREALAGRRLASGCKILASSRREDVDIGVRLTSILLTIRGFCRAVFVAQVRLLQPAPGPARAFAS